MAEQIPSPSDGKAPPPHRLRAHRPEPLPAPPLIRTTVLDIPGSGTRIIYISR